MTVPVNKCDPYTTCGGVEYTGIPAAQDPRIPLYIICEGLCARRYCAVMNFRMMHVEGR